MFAPLHTAVTVAPKCFASCTAAEPMLPEAPMISNFWPGWILPRLLRKYNAVFAPNGIATASSQLRESALSASEPLSGTHAYSAWPPPAMPVEATIRSP